MIKRLAMIGFTLLLTVNNVFAQDANKMTEKLKKNYPNLGIETVSYVKELNLYELVMAGNPAYGYTNENNDFFLISGELIDIKNKTNYTKEREFNKVKKFYNSLPKEKAIVIKYGKGTRALAIFTDPDCPYCKALDREIHTKLKSADITLYYYMNPLNIPGHEQAPLKAAKIWCSKDRGQAWINWMLNSVLPTNDGTCKNPVAETKEFATKAGFNGTPTIIFDNGYTASQQLTGEQLLQGLAAKNP